MQMFRPCMTLQQHRYRWGICIEHTSCRLLTSPRLLLYRQQKQHCIVHGKRDNSGTGHSSDSSLSGQTTQNHKDHKRHEHSVAGHTPWHILVHERPCLSGSARRKAARPRSHVQGVTGGMPWWQQPGGHIPSDPVYNRLPRYMAYTPNAVYCHTQVCNRSIQSVCMGLYTISLIAMIAKPYIQCSPH